MSRSRTSYSYTVQKTSRQRSSSFYCFKLPMALTTSSVPKFEAKISKQECAMCTASADGRAVGADAASRQSLTRQVMSRYRSVYDCVIIHTHKHKIRYVSGARGSSSPKSNPISSPHMYVCRESCFCKPYH